MMTYLLQLTLCWMLFYAAYHLFLRDETHFNYNRWYLLTAVSLGLVIPLIDWSNLLVHQTESLGNLYIAPFNSQIAEWDITVQATSAQVVTWFDVALMVYGIGSLIAAIKLIRGWLKILMVRRNSEIHYRSGFTLALSDQYNMPFSFLSTVYCSKDFYKESPDIDQILAHEFLHIRARHSLDIIFMEILKVVFWFHPMLYIYKNEIQQIHEYQADYVAYNLTTKKQYGKLLLSHAMSGSPIALTNPFFNSQLKNRFKMMTKKPSSRKTVLKFLVIFPLVSIIILLFSYSSEGKSFLSTNLSIPDTTPVSLRPPPPPLPLLGEELTMGSDKYTVSTSDLLYVNGRRIGYLTNDLIKEYSTNGPWILEVFRPQTAKERIDPSIETYVYSIRKEISGLNEVNKEYNPESKKGGEIFRVVEQMPRFSGCEEIEGDDKQKKLCADRKMLEFLYKNIQYPKVARDNKVEGNVVVSFIVEKDGSITDPKVIRDPGARLGEEALRVIDMMAGLPEKWTPGVQQGQKVRVQFILPVKFQLNNNVDNEEVQTKATIPPPPSASETDEILPPPPPPLYPNVAKGGAEVFRVVDQMPHFPGCTEVDSDYTKVKACADRKMLEFIYSNVQYPALAQKNGVEGNVLVVFVVEKDGSITNPTVMRDPGSGLGEEALRVVNLMKYLPEKWTPGVQQGQNVRVQFVLPIKFELVNEDENQNKDSRFFLVIDDEIIGVVDQVELNKTINVNDIESISVLKGENATAKYGLKGQNGVIEITSKGRKEITGAHLDIANVKIYPVPADNQLNIEGVVKGNGQYQVEVRDLKGTLVRERTIDVLAGNIRTHFDLNGLNAGLYYIMVMNQGKVFSKAFVKQ